MRLALCLQFFDGDKETAMRLARMIADVEEIPRDDVDFYFCERFDSAVDQATADYVAQKFPVFYFRSHTQWTGWPAGPNGLARDVLLHFETKPGYDGVLLIEPDCVPLHRYWLNFIMGEWQVAREAGKVVMGSWRGSGPPCGHLNGNACVIPNFASWLRQRGCDIAQMPKDLAWDCYHAQFSREGWHVTGRIKNRFQSRNATRDDLLTPETGDEPPALLHGFKDRSCETLARQLLKLDR